ncbi:MAG: ribonuclease PH [Tissierellia bacterium]|jgi:ribonuclease PH|nr:ribonuclease PH [Tissierellia bacterium]
MRIDGRNSDELRRLNIKRNILEYPNGSVLIEMGKTKIIVTAMIENKVPIFLKGSGQGWLTCEYSMLPASTSTRKQRDSTRGKQDGRGIEIQRLIGRALRASIDLTKIGERTIWIDVDVIQADGGTRCAAISGGFVALYDAVYKLYKKENLKEFPMKFFMAAVSVGKVQDELLLDLNYHEDSKAQVDMNVIMNDKGEFIEIQSSAEQGTFNEEEFSKLMKLAKSGVNEIIYDQKIELEELIEEIKNEKDSPSV